MSSDFTQAPVCYKTTEHLGFPYYRVGSDGSVWSKRVKGSTKSIIGPWWKLSPQGWPGGYQSVTLFDGEGGSKTFLVHALVLLVFVGPRPAWAQETRHLNDRRDDNRLKNLCWGTCKQNAADRERNGRVSRGKQHALKTRGSSHGMSKLTDGQVRRIRRLYATGSFTQTTLAKMYCVSICAINSIVRRKNWTHI